MTYTDSREFYREIADEHRKSQRENIGTLKPLKSTGQLGIFVMIFFGIMLLLMPFCENDDLRAEIICGIVFVLFGLLGLYLFLYESNFLVVYKEGKIIYRNTFRKTRVYDCKDIVHTYYTNMGGIQFVFRNGKKLEFGETETFFCYVIIVKEHLKGEFKGGFPTVIKVYLHPIYMSILWGMEAALLIWAYIASETWILLIAICWALVCLGVQTSRTTYDREKQILTCRRCGFAKRYDMREYHAKPGYEYSFLRKIKVYDNKKMVTEFTVSPAYKNQIKMIYALCNEESL